ncbi:uncharacterized protein N7477_000998 [Penicillium maclennaniae]|uniref:uncharacterized protein n=1 Tax=Penicillium maclennaniae TaxID=1343394 RepID=UPI00253FCD78|nr:uncharacterized protein N7477_000998 [Penicillium maclennaniae]KAJ5684653.1 hypothetical protein N7477_000998 [Penicillium maclennaniae]
MTAQNQADAFCLECHWEDFHIDGKNPTESSGPPRPQWPCSDHDHHNALGCEVDEACCDVDDCQVDHCALDCGSICDGFVECDASSVCSVPHCDDTHCGEQNCESTDPLCFEDHCCDATADPDCGFDSMFGLNPPFPLDTSTLLPSTTMSNHVSEPGKLPEHAIPGPLDPCYHHDFLHSYQAHANHCDENVSNHFECHDFQKDLQGLFPNQQYQNQTDVNPAEVFHMMGMCSDYSICENPQALEQQPSADLQKTKHDLPMNPLHCVHPKHHHVHGNFKNPNDLSLHIPRGPHRNHHRCRGHHHIHSHPYSLYSRQSRSSSWRDSTPAGRRCVLGLDDPDFSAEDSGLHICKWLNSIHGVKAACGATFADAGALQDHLVASHMNTIDGAKGNGYYCCWGGCHRPDEPFSQKSKLQGHFLTHSNYKNFRCSVCGKSFARQATLDRHERSHRGDKPYKCKICGKTFTDSSELKTHSRTHSGEKPFKCTYPGCNFQTGDSSNMSSHRLTHGERKHKCPYPGCTKSFTRPDQLKRHQRTTHKEASSTLLSPSPDHFTLHPFAVV